jgi:CDP-glucose 4,6-dehydratase
VVVVTSDKCYRESKTHEAFREDDPVGGDDPYSASKGAAELVSEAYMKSFFDGAKTGIRLATVRAGNVIGGGDWANDRVVPDMVRALSLGEPVRLRHPEAIRPWQHVLDPLSGYVLLAESLLGSNATDYVGAWNFGPVAVEDLTVASLVSKFISEWGDGSWTHSRPNPDLSEMECLRLDVRKSRTKLGWIPRWDVETAVDKTARWYKKTHRGELDARTASLIDIEEWSSANVTAGGTT